MAIASTTNLNLLVDEIVTSLAYESFYDSADFLMPELYDVRSSNKRRERQASLGGIGQYTEKLAGGAADEDTINQQFSKDFVHRAYAKQLPIERELIDDSEWGILQDISRQLGEQAGLTMEAAAMGVFNDAFGGAEYVGEDGLSLCNSTHVNAQGGNSQSNTAALALNRTNIETVRVAMRKFKNYRGDKLMVRPDALLVPVDLEDSAWEAVRSVGRPDTANRADNMYNGMFSLIVGDFLTDTNAWFMLDTRKMKQNLLWFMRVGLEIFGDGNLFTGVRRVGGYYRESHGFRHWGWVYGSNPS